jgi:hypothetical protein
VDEEKWARRWWEANCGRWIKVKKGALIKGVRKTMDEHKYLAKNLVVENPDASDIFIYNKKLLKKSTGRDPIRLIADWSATENLEIVSEQGGLKNA